MNKKVTIIGAGWLGFPLAQYLNQANFEVSATRRAIDDTIISDFYTEDPTITFLAYCDLLLHKIRETQQQTNDLGIYHELCERLFKNRDVIITIPPSYFVKKSLDQDSRKGSQFSYAEMVLYTAQLAQDCGATRIIFTSSTSVYGNSSGIIHEELPAMPKTANATTIREAEKMLETQISIPVTILRLAGLIGNGRHPIFHLSGRDNIIEPFNAINLLHIDDLIRAIHSLLLRDPTLSQHPRYEIYNLVTPFHPNRQSYYQTLAKQLNLPLPQFEVPRPLLKKIIDGQKITEQGDFCYRQIDLFQSPI